MSLAAALLLAGSAAAAPAASVKAFVDGIYARWRHELARGNWRYQPPRDTSVFAPELARLFAKEQRRFERTQEMGVIDAVPLCSCQDDEGLAARSTVVRADARRATVRVNLRFGGTPADRPLILQLVRLPAGWRIADIGADRDASLLRQLHEALDGERG